MRTALYVLPLIPYSFVLDNWRYKVFSGNLPPEEYNRSWWKMRFVDTYFSDSFRFTKLI